MADSFTTEIIPFGQIFVGGGGGDRLPGTPRLDPQVTIPAWIDERNPAVVGLYPPNNMSGPDIVTVEVIEGDFLGHPNIGAEIVLVGQMEFSDPMLAVWSINPPPTVWVPFQVEPDSTYTVWVEVAGRQEAIVRYEAWDPEGEERPPAIEHWWVTLKFLDRLT